MRGAGGGGGPVTAGGAAGRGGDTGAAGAADTGITGVAGAGGATTAAGGGGTGGRGGATGAVEAEIVGTLGVTGATGLSTTGATTAGRAAGAGGTGVAAVAGIEGTAGGGVGLATGGATTGLATTAGGAAARAGGATTSFCCVMAFSTSAGREMCDKSIFVLISSAQRAGRPRRRRLRFGRAAEIYPHFFRFMFLERTGMGLLLRHPDDRQCVENGFAFNFQLPGEIVDSNLTHPAFLVLRVVLRSSSQPHGVSILHRHAIANVRACPRWHSMTIQLFPEPSHLSAHALPVRARRRFRPRRLRLPPSPQQSLPVHLPRPLRPRPQPAHPALSSRSNYSPRD